MFFFNVIVVIVLALGASQTLFHFGIDDVLIHMAAAVAIGLGASYVLPNPFLSRNRIR